MRRPFLPKTPSATLFMQRLQWVSQHDVTNRMYLRTWQQNMATIRQYIATCNRRFQNTLKLRTHEQAPFAEQGGATDSRPKRPPPQPPPARAALHRRASTLLEKNRAPASPRKHTCNIHAAITTRFAASGGKPACIQAHSDRTWQQNMATIMQCSHYTAILFCDVLLYVMSCYVMSC